MSATFHVGHGTEIEIVIGGLFGNGGHRDSHGCAAVFAFGFFAGVTIVDAILFTAALADGE